MITTKSDNELNLNNLSAISSELGVSTKLAKILIGRGYDTVEKAEIFLHPGKERFINPLLLSGVSEAVTRINAALQNEEKVVIYGDYDADGICSVTVLYHALVKMGIDVSAVIPERADGYGLTDGVIENMMEAYNPDLVITVDCGISAKDKVAYLTNELGIDVIITDHHEVPAEIPECIVINCKLPNQQYGFESLCGAGVAYKLSRALIGEEADKCLDLVAIATIADSMPLTGENRDIVAEGLKLMKGGNVRPQINSLIKASALKEVTSTGIAFSVAPRINAAGRMGDAFSALDLFLTETVSEISALTDKLNNYNVLRQNECDALYRSAKLKASEKDPTSKVIVIYDKNWQGGILGIAAAKLAEEYNKPVILFVETKGILHGSARSIDGVNIFQAIDSCRELTLTFGGHAQAAGVSIKLDDLEVFESRLCKYLDENYSIDSFVRKTVTEGEITEKFTLEFAKELQLLEPFGIGNRKPLFSVKADRLSAVPVKVGSKHIVFNTPLLDMIYFSGADYINILNSPAVKNIVFEPNVSVFNGRESFKGFVTEFETELVDDKETELLCLDRQFRSVGEGDEFNTISFEETQNIIDESKKSIYGTLFVASSPSVIKKFNGLNNMQVNLFNPRNKSNLDNVVICLGEADLSEYRKVVYLDKPIAKVFAESDKLNVLVCSESNEEVLNKLSCDRQIFAEVFKSLKNLSGVYSTLSEVLSACGNGLGEEQVLFSLEVFIELGIFSFKNGRPVYNQGVKGDLNGSAIYRKINSLKQEICTKKS